MFALFSVLLCLCAPLFDFLRLSHRFGNLSALAHLVSLYHLERVPHPATPCDNITSDTTRQRQNENTTTRRHALNECRQDKQPERNDNERRRTFCIIFALFTIYLRFYKGAKIQLLRFYIFIYYLSFYFLYLLYHFTIILYSAILLLFILYGFIIFIILL